MRSDLMKFLDIKLAVTLLSIITKVIMMVQELFMGTNFRLTLN